MDTTDKLAETIAHHFSFPTGAVRLRMILRGLRFEVDHPGMRLTSRAPKCSTILRREFGMKGKPAKLLQDFETALRAVGIELECRPATH